jgi:hypothetical protein
MSPKKESGLLDDCVFTKSDSESVGMSSQEEPVLFDDCVLINSDSESISKCDYMSTQEEFVLVDEKSETKHVRVGDFFEWIHTERENTKMLKNINIIENS